MDTHGGDRGCVSIMSSSRTGEEARSERGLIASQDLCNQEKLVNPYHSVDAHVDALVPLRRKKQLSPQVERIVDRVWDRFVSVSEFDDRLGVQDLYCAILVVYNDINKFNPGTIHRKEKKWRICSRHSTETTMGSWTEMTSQHFCRASRRVCQHE